MNNQIQALAILPKLSEQQLIHALQANDGALPAYAVMAELQARKKRASALTAPQMPKTTVKQDMIEQSGGMGGLPSVATQPPPQMQQAPMQPPPQGMAAGGKIGYADGGDLRTGSWDDAQDEDPTMAAIRESITGIKAIPGKISKWLTGDLNRFRPGYVATPSLNVNQGPEAGWNQGIAASDTATAPSMPPPNITAQAKPPADTSGIGSFGATVKTPGGGVNMPTTAPYVPKEITPRSMEDILKEMPQDTSVKDAIAQLKAGDTSAKDLQDAKWEALMRTGLGMASTPGSFGYALAKGGEQGLNSLMANRKLIQQQKIAQDREMRNLAIAQGRQQLQDYGIARGIRSQDITEQNLEEQKRFQAAQLAQQAAEHRATLKNALDVAGMHLQAMKHQDTELGRMKLVEQVSRDVDAQMKAEPAWQIKAMSSPGEYENEKMNRTYQRLRMMPGLGNYYQMPQSSGTSFTAQPTGKVLSLPQ